MRSSRSRAAMWRRTPAGVSSSRRASSAALIGPCSTTRRRTRSWVVVSGSTPVSFTARSSSRGSQRGAHALGNSVVAEMPRCKEGMPHRGPSHAVPGVGRGRSTLGLVPSDAPALRVEQLRKRHGDRDVVAGLSLRAERGALTAVLGPNGAGKTTTIECCEGLRRPEDGRIEVLGLDRALPEVAAEPRRRVGVMLQEGGLPMAPRAGAVLRHVARLHDRPGAADPLLERLGLSGVARTRVRHLSGGQRRRLALACAIVGEPELVFLDEPTAGLDPQARLAVWELVRELRAEGTSIVLTTHLMTEAEELADHVVVVDRGTDVAAGSPAALRGAPYVRISTPPGTDAVRLATDLAP